MVIGTGNGYAVKVCDNESWLDYDVGSTVSGTGDYVALADDGVKLIYSLPGTTESSAPYGTVTLNLSSSSSDNWVIILVSILAVVVISGILGFFIWFT